jgi:predicted metal-dependent hydrolase
MSEPIPQEFWQGVEQFNSGQFYACHDTLEALWIEASEPEKTFYQGILQIAVALYHLGNRNWRGAVILLGEGSNKLRRYQSNYGGINLEDLLYESVTLLKALQQAGPDKIATSSLGDDETLFLPRITLINDEKIDL